MGKRLKVIILTLIIMLMATGCIGKKDKIHELTISSLEVYSAIKNSEHIYHVKYPYYYYRFEEYTNGEVTPKLENFNFKEENRNISEEDLNYLVDYISSLPEEVEKGENISYNIHFRYYDEEGEEVYLFRRGYDIFPEDWDVFIGKYNKILGVEVLQTKGELQKVTPELLTDIYNVTDEDVREGTLQDVIDSQDIDIVKLSDLLYINIEFDSYYASVYETQIQPHRPDTITSIDGTKEEYDRFIKEYLSKLGNNLFIEDSSDQEYLRRFTNTDTRQSFYIGRTCDIEKLNVEIDDYSDYYYILLDAHMEDMTYTADFVYSANNLYILIPMENNPDIILPFCEE